MPTTAHDRAAIALLEQTDGRAELYEGELREKPAMSFGHNLAASRLVRQLFAQLDPTEFDVRLNMGHAAVPNGNSYVPDIAILPIALMAVFEGDPHRFERYVDPLPLVVEVWSPSTGRYDIDAKIPDYRARRDAEIWRLHPFERTLTMWRRRPDGTYEETVLRGGTVRLHALPDVVVDLDRLFVS